MTKSHEADDLNTTDPADRETADPAADPESGAPRPADQTREQRAAARAAAREAIRAEAHLRRRTSEPTIGEMALDDRASLRRVSGLSTELRDVTEVEQRQLRLEQVVLVGVWTTGTAAQAATSMAELAALAETAGATVLDALIQRRDKPDPATYIGAGKAEELREVVLATGADTVICDGQLSPAQLSTLEKTVNVKVVDRTALILDIFAQHASSREGKAQVEYAQMKYMLPRLRGWGHSLSRQGGGAGGAGAGGGVGTRGPGETKLETDRRRIHARMAKLQGEIKEMKKSRDTKRGQRLRTGIPSVAIVGYTNAGKSSVLNSLTGSGVLVENALFATLDPTTRKTEFDDGRELVLTDTVGFVRHLPTQLVEAFRSTLEEVAHADLLLHVVDGSDPMPLEQIKAVNEVLAEVLRENAAAAPPELLVVNKIDVADPVMLTQLRATLPGALFISTHTGEGMEELRTRLGEMLPSPEIEVTALVPYSRGDLMAQIHSDGTILETDHEATGTLIRARVPRNLAAALAEYAAPGPA